MGLCHSKIDKTTRKETGATSTATTTVESLLREFLRLGVPDY
jgi:hypothetical protein